MLCFFFQAEDGIRDWSVTGVQTCALPISIAVEGVNDEHDDGQINEGEDKRGIQSQERRAAHGRASRHWKAQRFSRNSPRHSREMVMTRIPTEIAISLLDRKSTRLNSSH